MFIVTGAAGFIGSSLCDRLLSMGHRVLGIDNLSTGRKEFLESASESDKFTLVQGDITNLSALSEIFSVGAEAVFHLAANADIRFGVDNPRKDLEQNTIGTFNVLEAMRVNGIKKILFSSTGSV